VAALRDRIGRAGGDPERVTIVAVTKGHGPEVCRAAVGAGLTRLGENRAQELLAKSAEVADAEWHFVGRLQTNKVRALAPVVALWESVDRRPVIDELARRAPGARILVQVNISGEDAKGGCPPERTAGLVHAARDAGLEVRGLMGIGPIGPPEAARPGFRLLTALADELGLAERSMGMTADLEVAIEEGSTMIRVGTGLFGPRQGAQDPPD